MSKRKPVMSEDKRKVLNLLEFCAELCPSQRVCQIINNAIPPNRLIANGHDNFYITDKELAGWLQAYADLLLSWGREDERQAR
jgi:hypothetical protein